MKIDLHLHTKKIKLGESDKLNIDSDTFKQKLKDANIGVAAITNHEIFDEIQYKDFCSPKDYLLLPGIELDVTCEDDAYQVNLIGPDDNSKLIKDISDEIKHYKSKGKYPLDEATLIAMVKNKDIILCFDQKSNERTRIDLNHFQELKNKLENIAILDVNNYRSFIVFRMHSYNSIIGSDIKNWDNYLKESNRLVETPFKIKTFNLLRQMLMKNEMTLNELNSETRHDNFNILIKKDIYPIRIYTGLNVVFGDKAAGKTAVLESIRDEVKKDGKKITWYSSENKETSFKQIFENANIFNEATIVESKIVEIINEISKFKETSMVTPKEFWEHFFNKTIPTINIANISFINVKKPYCDYIIEGIKKIHDLIRHFENDAETKEISVKYLQHLVNFRSELIQKWITLNNTFFKNNFYQKLHKTLSKVLKNKNGIFVKPKNIGLFKRWAERESLIKLIIKLSKINYNKEENIGSYEIPDKGIINLIEKNTIYNLNKKITKETSKHHPIKKYNENVLPIFELIHKNWDINIINNFNDFFSIPNHKRFIIEKKILSNNDLSQGQRSLLTLLNLLDNDSEYIILDEPAVHLGTKTILKSFLQKISEAKKANKNMIISTHNSSLALNSMPDQLIYRCLSKGKHGMYCGQIYNKYLTDPKDENKKLRLSETTLNNFEGNNISFRFRKGIYEA